MSESLLVDGPMILDVGCGNQPFGDVNIERNIQQDDRLAPDNHPLDPRKIENLIRADGCHLPLRDHVFRHVRSCFVIEHVDYPIRFLRELIRVCHGTIEIYCPHRLDTRSSPLKNPRHKHTFNKKWFSEACRMLQVYFRCQIVEYRFIPHRLIPLVALPSVLQVVIFVP